MTCSRAGLAIHPSHTSARVTLGRALFQLGDLDEAQRELDAVHRDVPDNLASIRALAELHRARGNLDQSLAYYRAALELAKHDPELEDAVSALTEQVSAGRESGENRPAVAAADGPGAQSARAAHGAPLLADLDERELARALRTIAALEQWLAACHVARAH